MPFTYEYPHPAVTVDILVFTANRGCLEVLLVQRKHWPHTGKWALPGGFVEIDESLKRAAWRELREETGVKAGSLEQLGAFGRPDRDPRERVITVAYIALAPVEQLTIRAASDARDARLFDVDALPELAFDHDTILRRARQRLRDKLDLADVIGKLMPAGFTITELQRVYESISGGPVDKRNFRKKLRKLDALSATGQERRAGASRPARLYRAR